MSLRSEEDRNAILHQIEDDAIDEGFPPDAAEAAELDAAEAFVETMAMLALMEEKEEKARFEFNHVKKRWEVRRSEGLHGKPKPPKRVVLPANHDTKTHAAFTTNTRSLVPHSHHQHPAAGAPKSGGRQRETTTYRASPKVVMNQPPRYLVQQPRKSN